jgi:diadenosine tetraphosphate (Ap4A) HIT family hydrolase
MNNQLHREDCISCTTLAGTTPAPGGLVYQDNYWAFFLRARPLLVPGQGFVVLKRHCEHLSDLTAAELAALGPMMQRTTYGLDQVLKPAKVHFGLYGEAVQHLHLHVLPRIATLPASNITVTLLGIWYTVLERIGLKHGYPDTVVADIAQRLRAIKHVNSAQ